MTDTQQAHFSASVLVPLRRRTNGAAIAAPYKIFCLPRQLNGRASPLHGEGWDIVILTRHHGRLVQGENGSFASFSRGFDSPIVHHLISRDTVAVTDQAHNLGQVGSTPTPATTFFTGKDNPPNSRVFSFFNLRLFSSSTASQIITPRVERFWAFIVKSI